MRPRPRQLVGAGLGLVLLAALQLHAAPRDAGAVTASKPDRRPGDEPRAASSTSSAATAAAESPADAPRPFLIYLKDGSEPILVERYVEDNGEVRFQKYGGWVGIPTSEILKIVPDEPAPETAAALPSGTPEIGPAPGNAPSELYLTLRSGGNLKVTAVVPEGERVRVSVPDGSFTVPRADMVGLVRLPAGPETPEAWISIVLTGRPGDAPTHVETASAPDGTATRDAAPTPAGGPRPLTAPPALEAPGPRLPYERSDRPHFVRLQNGQLMRLDGFWVEDGQLRFQRFGGVIGVAIAEVMRLIPEEIAPVPGRTQVRFTRQVGPDLFEVAVKSGAQGVRLLGIAPTESTRTDESPWRHLDGGTIVYLEFDRQRYDTEGNWLAYVFLPNNRMLNAELIRLGLARPLADGRNLRYLDLFHELATGDLPDGAATAAPTH